MTKLTRRRTTALLAALPFAGSTRALAQQKPPAQPVKLNANELAMAAEMASEFELRDDWGGRSPTNVAATATTDATLRAGIAATVADTYSRLRGGAKYFYWADDDMSSVDYHHITAMGPTVEAEKGPVRTSFVEDSYPLTPAVLKRIAAANNFDIPTGPGARKVVFGLRGCVIDGAGGRTFGDSVSVREARPDHNHYRCVIGVWDPAANKIAVFKGSTVPLEVHLAVYQRWLEKKENSEPLGWTLTACMIPQGLHTKKVETMHMGSGTICPVTLKQLSPMPVLRERNYKKSAFTFESDWDPPANEVGFNKCHLHASINAKHKNADYQFSSQGCQTIDGWYEDYKPSGEIEKFNIAMGFDNASLKTKSYSGEYQFMLVTGREARLHAAGAKAARMQRVRIGSNAKSPDHFIAKLNSRLKVGEGKLVFDHLSMLKLVEEQKKAGTNYPGIRSDGIFTPTTAASGRFGSLAFPL